MSLTFFYRQVPSVSHVEVRQGAVDMSAHLLACFSSPEDTDDGDLPGGL